jgi:hypothetical protein
MTIENLPRPWVLAALTGLEITELTGLPADGRAQRQHPAVRTLPRRPRLRGVPQDHRPEIVSAPRRG